MVVCSKVISEGLYSAQVGSWFGVEAAAYDRSTYLNCE